MTSHEILKADVLDILFENRNKNYGAYALRKEYDRRLMIALGVAMSSIVLLFLLFPNAKHQLSTIINEPGVVTVRTISDPILPPPPPAPKPPRQQFAQEKLANRIQIVKTLDKPDVPDVNDLAKHNIGGETIKGPEPVGAIQTNVIATPNSGASTNTNTTTSEKDFAPLERQPEFPGGIDGLRAFLARYLVTPSEMEAGEKKTVYVRFIVNEDGTVTQFEITRSAGDVYDKEVLRVLKKMPKWKPALQNGRNVTAAFTQPVTFQTVEE